VFRMSRASLLARLPLYHSAVSAECATPTNPSLFAKFPRNLANAPLPPESFHTCFVCATRAHSLFCPQHWLLCHLVCISSSTSSIISFPGLVCAALLFIYSLSLLIPFPRGLSQIILMRRTQISHIEMLDICLSCAILRRFPSSLHRHRSLHSMSAWKPAPIPHFLCEDHQRQPSTQKQILPCLSYSA